MDSYYQMIIARAEDGLCAGSKWIQNKWDITDALGDKNNFFLYRNLKRCDSVISEKKIV